MDGFELVRIIERELASKGISKTKFYEDCGISSAVFSNWRKNINTPSDKNLAVISQYLGMELDKDDVFIAVRQEDDTAELRETLRTRPELKLLFNSLKDAPSSYIYQVLSDISKFKEGNE